eukprot:1366755-Rhodomonas_salina.3
MEGVVPLRTSRADSRDRHWHRCRQAADRHADTDAAKRKQHNTTQHNTAQHSTAQHNTTQHNTTQEKQNEKKQRTSSGERRARCEARSEEHRARSEESISSEGLTCDGSFLRLRARIGGIGGFGASD